MTSQKLTLTQQLLFYRHILKTITLTQNLIFCRIFINLKTYYIFSTFFLLFFVHDEVKVRSSIISRWCCFGGGNFYIFMSGIDGYFENDLSIKKRVIPLRFKQEPTS